MKIYAELKEDARERFWVEIGMREKREDITLTDVGTVAIGKTKGATLRKAARALKRESDRLMKLGIECQ